LVLYNLLNEERRYFEDITDYKFDDQGKTLLLKRVAGGVKKNKISLEWVSLISGKIYTIWSSDSNTDLNADVVNFRIDRKGSQVAFVVQTKSLIQNASVVDNTIWYYKDGTNKAIEIINNKSSGISSGLNLSTSGPEFSKDNRYIYFKLEKELPVSKPYPAAVSVDVWNYKDTLIQSTQLQQNSKKTTTYHAVFNIEGGGIIQLNKDYEFISEKPSKGDFVVVAYNRMHPNGDMYWLPFQETYYLESLIDGTRRQINAKGRCYFWFSPGGRYLLYYSCYNRQYYSYNLQTGNVANVSNSIPSGWLGYQSRFYRKEPPNTHDLPPAHGGVTGFWLENDQAVWVYDNYDIWQMDLEGKKTAVNITQGFGRLHQIEFRLLYGDRDNHKLYSSNDSLLLVAFNTNNKHNGFYRLVTGTQKAPELLVMGPWTWYHIGFNNELDNGIQPLKANDTNIWVVKRQSTTEAPNYFLTRDFKEYKPLSDLHPEHGYNWLTANLVTWKQLDGTFSQGILYKPENFDPQKKYPVLIHYYEQMSHRLYEYPTPEFSYAEPNIAWFVSRGYLVFTPDIYYTNSIIGKSAENSIVSGARYLGKLGYVDAKRIGIAGHSYGGHETYYLITHSDMFAAVLSSAGCTDVVSESLSLSMDGSNAVWMKSMEQRMGGATLWQNRDRYIDESAIFRADKVKTPLLILQNKFDDHWESGTKFFLALRRLGKKVWLLQYDQGSHILGVKKDQIDYTIRITQFFDHYLKNNLPPVWMTRGIPARVKGVYYGLELDRTGIKP
jgi:dipeptidyl aminopeptidase/acylaminoacyl peptidase